MIGVVYGLQAIIFILKREFMLVGWMVVYLLSYVASLFPSYFGVNGRLQVPSVQFLPSDLLLLAYGRLQLG